MKQQFEIEHRVDDDGNPAGGSAQAVGLDLQFQDGPMERDENGNGTPNGCFVETLLEITASRLEFYQSGKFACTENDRALKKVRAAIDVLNARMADREARGVAGTHEV